MRGVEPINLFSSIVLSSKTISSVTVTWHLNAHVDGSTYSRSKLTAKVWEAVCPHGSRWPYALAHCVSDLLLFVSGTLQHFVHREQRRKAAATPAFVRKTLNLNHRPLSSKEQESFWVFKHASSGCTCVFSPLLFGIKFEPLVHGLSFCLLEEVQMSNSTDAFTIRFFPRQSKNDSATRLTAWRLCEGACMCACVFKCAWGHVGHDEWRVCGERPLLDAPENLRTLPSSPEPPWLQRTRTGKLSIDWDQWVVSHCRK